MKRIKIYFILFIVFFGLLSFLENTSTKFYYAFDKRIELFPVKDKIIVKYREIQDSSTLASFIKTSVEPEEFIIEPIDYQSFYITLKPSDKTLEFIRKIKKNDEVLSVNPVYITKEGNQRGLTDEILVLFRENISENQKNELHSKYGVKIKKSTIVFDYLIVPPKENALEIANHYQESGLVEFAHPNFFSEIVLHQLFPNDTYFDWQITLHNTGQTINDGHSGTVDADIDAPEAWDMNTGDYDIVIAVIDKGVTSNHPDLPNTRQLRLNGSNFGSGNPNNPSPVGNFNHGNACAGV